ncbi:DUF6114 domain-containing protein [Streptomyces sp. NE06-03E]|uniref:DUF6114 domain-containing protein n=2 Tax=unclassified Streptomyces TaxID=2593676 RepID=A0AAU1LY86_9ACTN|nr:MULTISPECIES: DUF6114 domain-containing protein [Streptomyces]WSS71288.1 DUF6114 domain-containing protein [Streptomyces sp. NBC_01175]WSS78296.1 DUF6114 domain-containing protein [Streptomyces sp. NBC_01174]MBL1286156.1 hypothetical protein [Streptomyces silvae]MDX3054711.1 DUF6114 domain-containing protein [Streptomyces sp. NE06-03E]MDX3431044.1 DUF6114 domain-containing protein [Streptomyces sp. ME01-18a]
MSPESTGQNEHYLTVYRRGFRTWRGNRPFWAGLFTILGGLPIAYFPYANMHLGNMTIAMSTTAGAGSLIIGVLLITLGLTMWFHHIVRVFAGVAAILLALISIPVANIGGFIVGFLFSLLGGALSIAWVPGEAKAPEAGGAEAQRSADSTSEVPEQRQESHDTAEAPRRPTLFKAAVEADGGRHRAG